MRPPSGIKPALPQTLITQFFNALCFNAKKDVVVLIGCFQLLTLERIIFVYFDCNIAKEKGTGGKKKGNDGNRVFRPHGRAIISRFFFHFPM